jgi:fructose-bisphosphate aldolase class I
MNAEELKKMHTGKGFIAALDQSGGSTPKALELYGIAPTQYHSEEEMFDLVHAMRTRIITSPAFDGKKILGAILFKMTMEREVEGLPTADYLWERKRIVPFLKVDIGLDPEKDGCRLMKSFPQLGELCDEAVQHHIFGTKERSVILAANPKGIHDVVAQQFEWAKVMIAHDLVPIIEPEVDITIPDKKEAEALLKKELIAQAKKLGADEKIIFKVSIPTIPNFYEELADLPCVVRVVALSGGYSQKEANALLAQNRKMIASFSRALSEGLTAQMSDEEFNARLKESVDAIYAASVKKTV